jgi:hypothetical protein
MNQGKQRFAFFVFALKSSTHIQSVSNDVFFILVFVYDRIIGLIARRSLDTSRHETTFGLIATIADARRCHARMFS